MTQSPVRGSGSGNYHRFAPHCDARLRRLLGERQEGFEVPQGSYVLNQDGEDK